MIAGPLVAALDAAVDVPVYETPSNQPAVPSVIVTPSSQWADRSDTAYCAYRWTYEVHLLAHRADVDGAAEALEALLLKVLPVAPAGWTPVRVQGPTVRDVGGVDVIATTVTYDAQLQLPNANP